MRPDSLAVGTGAVIGWRGQGIDCDMGEDCDWLDFWVGQTRLCARLRDVSEEDRMGIITTATMTMIRRRNGRV